MSYRGTFATFQPYSDGEDLPVEYDASNPAHNKYLQREKNKRWVYIAIVAVTLLCVAIIISLMIAS